MGADWGLRYFKQKIGIKLLFGPTWRSYKLTCVRSSVCYQLFSGLDHRNFFIFGTKVQNGDAQNVTEPDFRKKIFLGQFGPKRLKKWGFSGFSRNCVISFFLIFWMRLEFYCRLKVAELNFPKKIFSGLKMTLLLYKNIFYKHIYSFHQIACDLEEISKLFY